MGFEVSLAATAKKLASSWIACTIRTSGSLALLARALRRDPRAGGSRSGPALVRV